ncbi:MAG: hydrogenase maturation nickel metallochaperone HypA [Bifidobacteriaceae bacterium]|nr:hydrogenase maturation nickel metallochaperone HypA [Bifidobacteriaceae bacterium]
MHELSLSRSIYGIAARAAGGRRVVQVSIDVGQLRQVVPETLTRCWEAVTAVGPLAGARLAVNHIPALVVCQDCEARLRLGPVLTMVCGACGGPVRVEAGDEFLVRSIDVTDGDG